MKGIFQLNSSFINHNIGVLKIDSQETNITTLDQGKIINYGSCVFFSLNGDSPSTISIETDMINYGFVDVKFDYWNFPQKSYIQFSGETSFINIAAERIEHYGGGFHGYETLYGKLGYDYYQGAIFPGGIKKLIVLIGQNRTGSLTIIGDFNILNFSCVIEFDIDSNNLNDVIFLDVRKLMRIFIIFFGKFSYVSIKYRKFMFFNFSYKIHLYFKNFTKISCVFK